MLVGGGRKKEGPHGTPLTLPLSNPQPKFAGQPPWCAHPTCAAPRSGGGQRQRHLPVAGSGSSPWPWGFMEPFGWWWRGAAAVPRPPRGGWRVSRVEPWAQLLPVPACACLCLSVLPVPACPARTSPACPLGPATLQPLKLALLIAARELIYIYWRLHPLAADPFIFNKEEESCLPWETGEERRFNRTNPGSSSLS